MNHSIINQKGVIKLARWEYIWCSDSFKYELGTSKRIFSTCSDKPFDDVIADCWPAESIKDGFFTKYPKNNTLEVSLKEGKFLNIDISKMKGYKKFFGHMNIANIKIKPYKNMSYPSQKKMDKELINVLNDIWVELCCQKNIKFNPTINLTRLWESIPKQIKK
jgi:hypothetical protein